jgi:two-component system sensor histidine kinase MprB
MSLRRRLMLLSAAAVAVAIGMAAVATYFLVRAELRDQIDDSLRDRAAAATFRGRVLEGLIEGRAPLPESGVRPGIIDLPPPPPGAPEAAIQVINADGDILIGRGQSDFPVSESARGVAAGESGSVFEDLEAGDADLRVLTVPAGQGVALQAARSLEEVNETLSDLVLILALIAVAGIGVGGAFGLVVARAALTPVARATATATAVAETGDLSKRIEVEGSDELAELSTRFNEMLEALDRSYGAQRRLVADASHELRTPLTSLRTNIELVADRADLPEAERRHALAEATAELTEMAHLIDDVVELARDGGAEDERARILHHDVRLDEVVASAVGRAQRRAPAVEIVTTLAPTVVTGDAQRLGRAVSNLLDNAIKFAGKGGSIEVGLEGGRLRVRDHGPGFEPGDLPHVFERFYRATGSRGLSGSGLGLAIVERVAGLHGASVAAANAEGGGAVLTITFPDWQPPEA